MSSPYERLAELGLSVPEVVPPLAAYVPGRRSGAYVYTSGQLPMRAGTMLATGKVGAQVSAEQATQCARQAGLNAIAAVASQVDLADVAAVVKVVVYVASTPEFAGHAAVANGASELLGEVFGDAGHHARSAVGVASLPLDAPVEVEIVVEVR